MIVEGPDEDGDFKLSNLDGIVVGGEGWIPFVEWELAKWVETLDAKNKPGGSTRK